MKTTPETPASPLPRTFPYLRSHQLKHKLETLRPESRFFDRDAMRHCGDTMANYGVRPCRVMRVRVHVEGGHVPVERPVYELYRRKVNPKGLHRSAFFDAETMEKVVLWAAADGFLHD